MEKQGLDNVLEDLESALKKTKELEEFIMLALFLYFLPEDYKTKAIILRTIFQEEIIEKAKYIVSWDEKIFLEAREEFKKETEEMTLSEKMDFLRENISSIKKMLKEKLWR